MEQIKKSRSRKCKCTQCNVVPRKGDTHLVLTYGYSPELAPLCITRKGCKPGPRTVWEAWDVSTDLMVSQALARRDMWHATFRDMVESQTNDALGAQRYHYPSFNADKYPEWYAFDTDLAADAFEAGTTQY